MSLSSKQTVAVILAGGFGTRVRHVLPDLPKPMAPTAGRPFIEWVVRFLAKQGVRRIVVSTGYMAQKIEDHFVSNRMDGLSIRCFYENAPLGTAGGFMNAVHLSGENPEAWLVLNGDSLVLAGLSSLFDALDDPEFGGAVLGKTMSNAHRYGTLVADSGGRLVKFAEKQARQGMINAGVYLLRSSVLPLFPRKMPQSFEQDVFPLLIEARVNFRLVPTEAPFLDIGTEETLKQAEGFILQNKDCFLNC